MKKCFFILFALCVSVISYAGDINMVGDPPESHANDGHRGQALLPTVDYTDGEVTIFVPKHRRD